MLADVKSTLLNSCPPASSWCRLSRTNPSPVLPTRNHISAGYAHTVYVPPTYRIACHRANHHHIHRWLYVLSWHSALAYKLAAVCYLLPRYVRWYSVQSTTSGTHSYGAHPVPTPPSPTTLHRLGTNPCAACCMPPHKRATPSSFFSHHHHIPKASSLHKPPHPTAPCRVTPGARCPLNRARDP